MSHIDNIKIAAGINPRLDYKFTFNVDPIYQNYMWAKDTLRYELNKNSKYRRAIIYNKSAIEKQIQQMINKALIQAEKEFVNLITADIEANLNSLVQLPNGNISLNRNGITSKSNTANLFAQALAKGLIKGFFEIIDDITDQNDDYNRR